MDASINNQPIKSINRIELNEGMDGLDSFLLRSTTRTVEAHVGGDEMTRGQRTHEGELTSHHCGCDDLRKLPSMITWILLRCTRDPAQEIQHGTLSRETRPSTHSPDLQTGHRDTEIQILTSVHGFHLRHAVTALHDLGRILSGRDEGRGDDVRSMGIGTSDTPRHLGTDEVLGKIESDHVFGCRVQDVLQDGTFDDTIRDHTLPPTFDEIDRTGFLVRAHVPGEGDDFHFRELFHEVFQGLLRAFPDHVHPHRITGGRLEPEEDFPTRDVGSDGLETSEATRAVELRGQLFEIGFHEAFQFGSRSDILRLQDRCSAHTVLDHFCTRTSGHGDRLRTSGRARDQGTFRRRHRDIVFLFIDPEWTCDPDWDRHDSDHVLTALSVDRCIVVMLELQIIQTLTRAMLHDLTTDRHRTFQITLRRTLDRMELHLSVQDILDEFLISKSFCFFSFCFGKERSGEERK